LKEAVQAQVMGGRQAQGDHFSGKPGSERCRATGGPGKQDAHAEVRDRELQQEDPELAGADDRRGLEVEHDRGDRQQARDAPARDLSDSCGSPDRRERGQQPGIASAQPGSDSVRGAGEPGSLSQAPRRRVQ
jgi:hypothetical protein